MATFYLEPGAGGKTGHHIFHGGGKNGRANMAKT